MVATGSRLCAGASVYIATVALIVFSLWPPRARYLGVVMKPGKYDISCQVRSSSKVAFEWAVGGAQDGRTEVVTAFCYNVVRPSGVPAPKFVGNIQGCQIDAAELRRVARDTGNLLGSEGVRSPRTCSRSTMGARGSRMAFKPIHKALGSWVRQ